MAGVRQREIGCAALLLVVIHLDFLLLYFPSVLFLLFNVFEEQPHLSRPLSVIPLFHIPIQLSTVITAGLATTLEHTVCHAVPSCLSCQRYVLAFSRTSKSESPDHTTRILTTLLARHSANNLTSSK